MAKNRKAQRANPKRQRRALHLEFQEYVVLITGWNWSYSLSLDTSRPIGFKLLYGFVIIRLDRRDLVWIGVTTNPTAEWVARQITGPLTMRGAIRAGLGDLRRACTASNSAPSMIGGTAISTISVSGLRSRVFQNLVLKRCRP